MDIKDNGDGTVSTTIHKGGTINVRATHIETLPSGTYTAIDDVTLSSIDLTSEYTPLPQEGLSLYEYSKNVGGETIIGEIAFGGLSQSPLSISIKPSSNTAHTNDYLNFKPEISSPTSSPVTIKTVNGGTSDFVNGSLKAKTYIFNIEVTSGNRAVTEEVTLIVNKTTPIISFSDTTQKDMKVGDALHKGQVTTTNTDTLTTSSITYALTGGIAEVLNVSSNSTDPLGYDISIVDTHTGVGLPSTFMLQATVKESANFEAQTTSVPRKIFAYKGLSSLTWASSKGSYSTDDVVSGAIVGTLQAIDGVGPYTYELVDSSDEQYDPITGADNTSFVLSNTIAASGIKVNVKTSTSLLAKNYKLQFKVSDSKGNEMYTTGEIVVSSMGQVAFEFKDAEGGNIITTIGKKVKYNDINSKLYAEGGSTTSSIVYDFAPDALQPNGVEPSDYAEINTSNGLIKPIQTGTIKVQAKRPGDIMYGDAISYMDLTIEPAEQAISFLDTTSIINIQEGMTKKVDAKGTIKVSGATGKGSIVYSINNEGKSYATVDENTGEIHAIASGEATLTALLNGIDDANYNANYDTVFATKPIKVYKGMSIEWTPTTPFLKAEKNISGDVVGSLLVKDNQGLLKYEISTKETTENADAEYFQVLGSGTNASVQLSKKISANVQANHGGTFKVQVDVNDTNRTQIIDLSIQIDEAENDMYFTENGNKVSALTKQFGEAGNTFSLTSYSSNSGNVTYDIEPSDTSGTLSVSGTGAVTIHKVGSAKVQAVIGSGSGYVGGTIKMPITITQGSQSIAFKDTTTLNRQFVINQTFSDPALLKQTSANTLSARTITYASNTSSICSIDAAGTITMLDKGMCEVSASNSDADWKTISVPKKINLYDGMGVSFTQSNTPQAETATAHIGSPIGGLTVNGGSGTKTYAISTTNDPQNRDASFFTINNSGVISLAKAINASDITSSYDTTKQAYIMYVQFETSDELGNKVTSNGEVEIKGAPLNAKFDRVVNGKITQTYSPNGTFTIQLTSNAGNGSPSYQIKDDPTQPNDVLLSVSKGGLVSIDNANDRIANPKAVMVEAIIPPSGGYDKETIEVEVEIIKANQPNFTFANTTIQMPINSILTPIISGQLSTGTITLTSLDSSLIEVSGSDFTSNTMEGTGNVIASDTGDRNYNIASSTASITVSSAPAYNFTISVPLATYGDTGLKASIVVNGGGVNQAQTWLSSDPSIADIDASGNITIYKAGKVNITCTQTTTGEPSVSSTAVLTVKPKPITITINDKHKYVGERVPVFDMTIPSGVLIGSDSISLPTFDCVDTLGAAVIDTTPTGSYSITATFTTDANPNYNINVTPGTLTVKQDTSKASWYHIEGVTSGSILDFTKWHKEDVKVVLDTASDTAGTYNEISLDQTLWNPTSILVNKEDENSEDVYFRIHESGILSSPQSTTIKIDKSNPSIISITGTQTNKIAISSIINNLTFGNYFKAGTKVNIMSEDILPVPSIKVSGVKEVSYNIYEIDKATGSINTTPISNGLLMVDATGKSEVVLKDTGLYRVCAIATDNAGNSSVESCSDLNIKNIDVDIDKDGENEFQDANRDGCPDINIPLSDKEGKIYKLNVDTAKDGVPDLNIDSDGDGIAEINVDTDKDKKPDLNLVVLTTWTPTYCVTGQSEQYCTMQGIKAEINVDINNDRIPDINIDTDGDFIADFNISKDGKTPSINIGIIHAWKPNKDGKINDFSFDYMQIDKKEILTNIDSDKDGRPDLNIDLNGDGIPDINIDTDGDWIPNINIDGNGDGKADFNIDSNKDGEADENIVEVKEWKPEKDGDKEGFLFDTMEIVQGKNEIEDNNVVVKNPEGVFLPNFSLKVNDITDTTDDSLKKNILEKEEGKTIEAIYDVKLMKDQIQVQPDGKLQVKIPVPKNAKNPYLVIEQADGSFIRVEAKLEDGYLIYESDFLGKIGVLGDKAFVEQEDTDEKPDLPPTSVKGFYCTNMGGAWTGDTTHYMLYVSLMFIATGVALLTCKRCIKKG